LKALAVVALLPFAQQASANPAAKLARPALKSESSLIAIHARHKHKRYRDSDVVDAPTTYVDTRGRNRVWVDAPFTAVRVHPRGVWVRAPFVNLFVSR
jgi:hypothetical protein